MSIRNPSRPAQTMRTPSCTCPSRSRRPASPFSRSTSTVVGSSTPARIRLRTCSRLCRSTTTLSTPWRCRISASSSPAGPAPTMPTCVLKSPCAGDPARLQELFQRLAAEMGHHLRIGDTFGARELLQAEEARAVVLHRLPVEAPHHAALFLRQFFHRRLGIAQEELAPLALRERVQEAVEAQALGATLQVEHVLNHKW